MLSDLLVKCWSIYTVKSQIFFLSKIRWVSIKIQRIQIVSIRGLGSNKRGGDRGIYFLLLGIIELFLLKQMTQNKGVLHSVKGRICIKLNIIYLRMSHTKNKNKNKKQQRAMKTVVSKKLQCELRNFSYSFTHLIDRFVGFIEN